RTGRAKWCADKITRSCSRPCARRGSPSKARRRWRMAVLEALGLNVRFGEHHAVRDVDLKVDTGSIVGLIGPNGAGKTTTFNAITGVQRCTGRVVLDGTDISSAPPHRRARLGMNRTFQRLEVFGSMTARDN